MKYKLNKTETVEFTENEMIIKGKTIPYEKITSFDYDWGTDYTSFFINGNRLKVYGVNKKDAASIKAKVLNDVTPEQVTEILTIGTVWKAKKLTWFGMPWTFTSYRLTNDRFYVDSGVLVKNQTELRLYRVLDIKLRRGPLQRIFGLGSITIVSNDKDTPELEIKNVKNPQEIKDLISEKAESERKRNNIRMGEIMDGGFYEDNRL